DRDSRRTRVCSFPPRKFVALHQEVAGDNCTEKSAVKDAAGTQEIERQKQCWILTIIRFGEQHEDLRTNEAGEQHPQTEVIDLLVRQPIALREPHCDQDRAEKRDSEKDAIGIDGETANMKNLRIHNLCTSCFVLSTLCVARKQSTKNKARRS